MVSRTNILCIGSVLWDVVGRAPGRMDPGADVPGRIARHPGGVAMNIAMTLRRFGLTPRLLSAVGRDAEGDELIAAITDLGIATDLIHRPDALPTDRYMAIEDETGVVAAVADARTLEAADDRILAPLVDGRIAGAEAPYRGIAALDGNLSDDLLARIAGGTWLRRASLRIAPASPSKAMRMRYLLRHPSATFYLNLQEANLILGAHHAAAPDAARALATCVAGRVAVTDGAQCAAIAEGGDVLTARPPRVIVARVTGAGDTFMAAHIAAECRGAAALDALRDALAAAAAHVSGDTMR